MSKCLICKCEEKRDNIGLCQSSDKSFICLHCHNKGYNYNNYKNIKFKDNGEIDRPRLKKNNIQGRIKKNELSKIKREA